MSDIYRRIITICLYFFAAVVPLLVNPLVINWVELVKRKSAYVLLCLLAASAAVLACKKKTRFASIPCPWRCPCWYSRFQPV